MSVTRVRSEVAGYGKKHGGHNGGHKRDRKDWTSSKSWSKKSSCN